MGVSRQQLISTFFTRTYIFKNTSERLLFIFFSFTAMYQTRIYFFISLFLQKIRCLLQVSGKLRFGICLIIPNVYLKYFPAYQNIEVAFERYHKSTLFVQTCDEIQHFPTSSQKQENVQCKFTNNCTPSQAFFKELDRKFKTTKSQNIILKVLVVTSPLHFLP